MKKIITFILVVFSINCFGQHSGNTSTGKISFKKKTETVKPKPIDNIIPIIEVLSPIVKTGDTLNFKDDFLLLKIKANDSSGIKAVTIKNSAAVKESDGIYSKRINSEELSTGINRIVITATDNNNNTAYQLLLIKYFHDKIGPLITLLEPILNNNLQFITEKNKVWIKTRISDESDIKKVDISGISFNKNLDEIYNSFIELKTGDNRIKITAEDTRGNISSKEFTILNQPDLLGPAITVLEPMLPLNNEITNNESMIAVRISVKDPAGIAEVTINKIIADSVNKNEFYTNIYLQEGKNIVSIKAKDKNNNISEKLFTVTRQGDIAGPIVKIIEPYASRGIMIIHKNEVIKVKGIAIDASGVREVTINNRLTDLSPNGEFKIDLFLDVGANALIVKAIDNRLNITLDTLYITRKVEELISRGKYYALIIGINKYQGIWPELKNAVNDAKAVEKTLRDNYTFDEIITLYDEQAARKIIIQKIESLEEKVKPDDNVLIFYSGHGDYKPNQNRGYWVPVDAVSSSTADFISNPDIQTHLKGISSRHTLLIADACFTGDIFRGRTQALPFENTDRYFKEVYRKHSRKALTSGGVEPVTDGGKEGHSVFTYYLLHSLLENTAKYITGGQLFDEIKIPITNNSEQTPNYQAIKNTDDEGGEFIFIKK